MDFLITGYNRDIAIKGYTKVKRKIMYHVTSGLLYLLSLVNLLFSRMYCIYDWEWIICLILFTVIPLILIPIIRYRCFHEIYEDTSPVNIRISTILLGISFLLFLLLLYAQKMYGNIPFGQLLYHLNASTEGTNWSQFKDVFILLGIGIAITLVLLFITDHVLRNWWRPAVHNIYIMLAPVFLVIVLYCFYIDYGVDEYISYAFTTTTLYDDYYVDPASTVITFPQKKRNLVYIYMESMESSYADRSVGGGQKVNVIPELTDLAFENENFSDQNSLNGALTVVGTTYTMGGLVAQTTGLPINSNYITNEMVNDNSTVDYFTGATNLGDILAEQGYNQEFLLGSDSTFAGRKSFFEQHGNYDVKDYYSAIDNGWIDKDYLAWWGYEDEKLYAFARSEMKRLAQKGEPFNLTLLTADTHFTDGYACELCPDTYRTQYANVLSCASTQVADFISWIQTQDFYDNTTIIISGDHLTMDANYTDRFIDPDYTRKTYVTVINPAVSSQLHTKRDYTTMDLFPTTLAALGAHIPGDRLALGTNLFSSTPTLTEELGFDYLNEEVQKQSKTYKHILLR